MHWSLIEGKNLFAVTPPEFLYHYTNYNGANGIITSKSFRLTKMSYLNDLSELRHAIKLLKQRIRRRCNKAIIQQNSDYLNEISNQIDSFSSTNICVGSFCEDRDILSQWRAYGNDGHGVALGFKTSSLIASDKNVDINLWKCVYDHSDKHLIIDQLIELLLQNFEAINQKNLDGQNLKKALNKLKGRFNYTFLKVASVLKHTTFKEEQEWRLITNSIRYTNPNYHALISDSRVSQYYSICFEPNEEGKFDFIGRISFGPCNNSNLILSAFTVLFHNNMYSPVNGYGSQIPYRNSW